MFDGAEFGKAIAAHPGDTEAALADYEQAMFSRSETAAADAHRALGLFLNERVPFGLIDFFIDALEREHDRSNSELRGDTGASVPSASNNWRFF